ncbi:MULTISPECIES: GntR family transcriptional regulator [Streptomyces]|uniref:GntR family transcriptional regulator n=1 Tax=Streptomyces TaxID=1883 RepID=UPI0014202FBA|nr:GntR family transcriptional regulator [Streptomyces sp. MBT27]
MSVAGSSSRTPTYQSIAADLAKAINSGRIQVGAALPPERALAQKYGAARHTVRSALELLREEGLVFTGRRGTVVRTSSATEPSPRPGARQEASPFVATVPPGPGRLFSASVAPALAAELSVEPGRSVLTYRYTLHQPLGDTAVDAITYFTPRLTDALPQLRTYAHRLPVTNPDLKSLPHWCEHAGLTVTAKETMTLTRNDHVREPTWPLLRLRRRLYDQTRGLLALTDLCPPLTWSEVTVESGQFHSCQVSV